MFMIMNANQHGNRQTESFGSGRSGRVTQARMLAVKVANVVRKVALISPVTGRGFAALSLLFVISSAGAQQSTSGDDATTNDSAAQTLTSTEQGRTTINDSFTSRQDKIRAGAPHRP